MKDNPQIYRHFIQEFYDAYNILKKEHPLPIYLFFIKAFLLGRVIELILKIQLIQKGHISADLKKNSIGGHNLIKLLVLLGFPESYSIDITTYKSIENLNSFYENKNYEYPQTHDVEIKNVKFLENFIELSISKIDFHLQNDGKKANSKV